ncbi:MAG: nucleoside triphosphate pyrophosphohydrolase [Chromatiales bacterium]
MATIDQLLDIMDRLRDPDRGCPWDREQSFRSIVPHTLEEAYEVADTIERERYGELPGELGDLLFQVVFYARLGKERGWFDFSDVVQSICDKLVHRHPHVFGDAAPGDSHAQSAIWESFKEEERRQGQGGRSGVLDGVARALPALTHAAKLQKRAARVGFDWAALEPVLEKVAEELQELRAAVGRDRARTEAELGDLLFACVNLGRHAGVDAEQALRGASHRFEQRFRYIEAQLRQGGRDIRTATLEEMDRLWAEAKRREASSKPACSADAPGAMADTDRASRPGRSG